MVDGVDGDDAVDICCEVICECLIRLLLEFQKLESKGNVFPNQNNFDCKMIVILWFLVGLSSSTDCCVRCGWKSVECQQDVVVALPQLGTDNSVGCGRHVLKLERPRLQHGQ